MALNRYSFDPFEQTGLDAPTGRKKGDALRAIADFVLEEVLSSVATTNSPVEGHGKFQGLSKEYRASKRASGRPGRADLEFTGKMLEAIRTGVSAGEVFIQIKGKQGDKADGHNHLVGDGDLPVRRFIPDKNEAFKKSIMKGVRRLIRAHQE